MTDDPFLNWEISEQPNHPSFSLSSWHLTFARASLAASASAAIARCKCTGRRTSFLKWEIKYFVENCKNILIGKVFLSARYCSLVWSLVVRYCTDKQNMKYFNQIYFSLSYFKNISILNTSFRKNRKFRFIMKRSMF